MKNSFKYLLKQAIPLIIVLSIVFISYYDLSCMFSNCHYQEGFEYAPYLRYPDPNTFEIVIVLAIATAIIPILNFARYKNKNAVDVYFSLPLTKKSFYIQKLIIGFIEIIIPFTISYFIGFFIFLCRGADFYMIQYIPMYLLLILAALFMYIICSFFVKLIIGFIEIIIPFTISYFIGFIIFLCRGADFYMIQYIPMYLLLVIASLFMYIICSFFVIKANNIPDSIIFIILYVLITTFIFNGVNSLYNLFTGKFNMISWEWDYLLAPYGPMQKITDFYKYYLKTKMPNYSFSNKNAYLLVMFVSLGIHLVLASLALLGIFMHIKNAKNEDADEKSKTWFGYKTMIPILFVVALINIAQYDNPTSYFLMSAIYMVSYIVLVMAAEFRSVNIPKSRYITLVSIYVSYTIIYLIFNYAFN